MLVVGLNPDRQWTMAHFADPKYSSHIGPYPLEPLSQRCDRCPESGLSYQWNIVEGNVSAYSIANSVSFLPHAAILPHFYYVVLSA